MNEQPAVAIDAPFEPLVRRIIDEATVIDSRILKIDHFLNLLLMLVVTAGEYHAKHF